MNKNFGKIVTLKTPKERKEIVFSCGGLVRSGHIDRALATATAWRQSSFPCCYAAAIVFVMT